MSKQSQAMALLPPEVRKALQQLGANLALARRRRRETQHAWASRLGVSTPTLIRLEQGDPGVAMGTYATALWLMGRAGALPELADPALDRGALEMSIREAAKRSVRSRASIEKRLASAAAVSIAPETTRAAAKTARKRPA
jgi:transcriptional regulator with XRE-family HTH domain